MNKTYYFFIAFVLMFFTSTGMFSQLKIDSVAITDISCYGYDDGKISVFISGGSGPYIYGLNKGLLDIHKVEISKPTNDQSYTFKNLKQNEQYWVFVEDNDNNSFAKKIDTNINEPQKLTVKINHASVSSNSEYSVITVIPSGGTKPYQLYDENNNLIRDDFENEIELEVKNKNKNFKWQLIDNNNCKLSIEFETD